MFTDNLYSVQILYNVVSAAEDMRHQIRYGRKIVNDKFGGM